MILNRFIRYKKLIILFLPFFLSFILFTINKIKYIYIYILISINYCYTNFSGFGQFQCIRRMLSNQINLTQKRIACIFFLSFFSPFHRFLCCYCCLSFSLLARMSLLLFIYINLLKIKACKLFQHLKCICSQFQHELFI